MILESVLSFHMMSSLIWYTIYQSAGITWCFNGLWLQRVQWQNDDLVFSFSAFGPVKYQFFVNSVPMGYMICISVSSVWIDNYEGVQHQAYHSGGYEKTKKIVTHPLKIMGVWKNY